MTVITADAPSRQTVEPSAIGLAFRAFEQAGMDALYARARREEPVFFAPDIGYWVVTRRADILEIFRDPIRFSAGNALTPVTPLPPEVVAFLKAGRLATTPVQVNADPPVHTRIRALAGRFLNMKRFVALEPAIRALVEGYADRLEGRAVADLVSEVTYELPARVIFLLLGIPEVDTADIKRWADNRLLLTWGELDDAAQMAAAREMLDYWHYCRALVEDRLRAPRADDYPSRLLEMRGGDDAVLTVNEVVCLVFGILLAGHETTTNASTNLVRALLLHRGEWERLVDDPSLIPNAVEEGLRFATSVVAWRRIALEDVTVAGVRIPAGGNILLALTSGNRDADVFEDPDRFDVGRANARQHVSFGHGIHVCLGAPLARVQLKVILEVLTRRFPAMALVAGEEPDWVRTISFRGPTTLMVAPHGPGAGGA